MSPDDIPGPLEKLQRLPNLAQRTLTIVAALPLVLLAVFWGDWPFALLALFMATFATLEFFSMGRESRFAGELLVGTPVAIAVVLAYQLERNALWQAALVIGLSGVLVVEFGRRGALTPELPLKTGATLAGVLYLGFPLGFMIALRALPDGLTWLATAFAITWATDTAAFFGGRLWGRRKLAPRLSPKKTVEGAVAGAIGGMAVALLVLLVGDRFSASALPMIALAPFVAIGGDLLESAIKRFYGVKDSYIAGLNILPGHGGVLDRIDSLIWVVAWVYVYVTLIGLSSAA